jgi:hypothetical protein
MTYKDMTPNEKIEYLEDILHQIDKICENTPPSYAYCDSEAGYYMANLLEQISFFNL